ncbi:MAG: hypothetical protein ABJE95_10100 [Byssovorax sp.]
MVAPDADVAAWAMEPIDIGLGCGSLSPRVLGPTSVPLVTDVDLAKQETELAILSAVAHGNGPRGLDVVQAVLSALARFDEEHAAVYFQIVYTGLREPMRKAWVMERQAQAKATFPPFAQALIDRGKLEGKIKGKLEATRDVLLLACADLATLDRWVDNVLGAKTAADVLS